MDKFIEVFGQASPNEQVFLLNQLPNAQEFTRDLVTNIAEAPSEQNISVLTACLSMHAHNELRSLVAEYFSLPLWLSLSTGRAEFELSSPSNQQLSLAFSKIKQRSTEFAGQGFFFKKLIDNPSTPHEALKQLTVVLLSQPSLRRFVKPFLEDTLLAARLNIDVELVHYPINEFTGVYYETVQEHYEARFKTIKELHSLLLACHEFKKLADLSTIQLASSISSQQLDYARLLHVLKCQAFPENLPTEVLQMAVKNLFYLPPLEDKASALDLNATYPVLPLTTESLALHDLLDRHHRLLHNMTSKSVDSHVSRHLSACKPVINRLGKTEFGGWTRHASEVIASAVTKRNLVLGQVKSFMFEVSISTIPIDQFTLSSWLSLSEGSVVVVGKCEGDQIVAQSHAVVHSVISSKNLLTFTLEAFKTSLPMDAFNSINFIVKFPESESNNLRLLQSLLGARENRKLRLPEAVGDYLLGISESCPALSITYGPFISSVTSRLVEAAKAFAVSGERTVIIIKTEASATRIHDMLIQEGINGIYLNRLSFDCPLAGLGKRYRQIIQNLISAINNSVCAPLAIAEITSCRDCEYIFKTFIHPRWQAFSALPSDKQSTELYPFTSCLEFSPETSFEDHFASIKRLFDDSRELVPLEILYGQEGVAKFALTTLSRIVIMTSSFAAVNHQKLHALKFEFDNFLIDDAHSVPELESLLVLSLSSSLKRLQLYGHPVPDANLSLMQRFMAYGFKDAQTLTQSFDTPFTRWKSGNSQTEAAISPLKYRLQFINVPSVLSSGEEEIMPGYIQNLDEAEYTVALYQLFRFSGISADDLAIITSEAGQVDLIRDVLSKRCDWNSFFGRPSFLGTIEQSAGFRAKHVIVSLIRTRSLGHLADFSRLDLAVSRGNESVIVLGSLSLFSNTPLSTLPSEQPFASAEDICRHVYNLSTKQLQ